MFILLWFASVPRHHFKEKEGERKGEKKKHTFPRSNVYILIRGLDAWERDCVKAADPQTEPSGGEEEGWDAAEARPTHLASR